MLTEREQLFLLEHRVGRLATAGADAFPHVVPVCFAVDDNNAYITIDEKPKRGPAARLKRVRNIIQNSAAALCVDHYEEDWSRLGWVMLRGSAEILESGAEYGAAQAMLRARYPQLHNMQIEGLPVIAIRFGAPPMGKVTSWGNLGARPG